jgi:hypothetical protein
MKGVFMTTYIPGSATCIKTCIIGSQPESGLIFELSLQEMKFGRLIPILIILVTFLSCKNDLKLAADYKEIPSIFAVLNPQENLQMIRVNKTFLGEGDANVMARVADSINYNPGELLITLTRYVNNKKNLASVDGDSVIVFRDSVIQAANGAFNPTQRVYVSGKRLFTTGQYRLKVINQKTGKIFTSHADVLPPITVFGFPLTPPYRPYAPGFPEDAYINYSQNKVYEVKHYPSIDPSTTLQGFAYQLTIRLWMDEFKYAGDPAPSPLIVDYQAGTKNLREAQTLAGQKFISQTFSGAGIYATVGSELSKLNRNFAGLKVVGVEYIIYSTSQEYVDYMEYVKPAQSIGQTKPLYSNFDNADALGLFTFRARFSVTKEPSAIYVNSFSDNPSTCKYNFYTSANTIRGCK